MRTATKETKVYTVEELKELFPTAFEKAHEQHCIGVAQDNFGAEFVMDQAKEIGAMLGITIKHIYYSGFYSQGDGACFEGDYEYKKGAAAAIKEEFPQTPDLHTIADRLQALQRKYFYKLTAGVAHRGHHYHEHCTVIDVDTDDDYRRVTDEDAEEVRDILRDFMHWIYTSLRDDFEYRCSEEQFVEDAKANEWEFTEEGGIY
jgi:hypothetical protein